MALKKAVLAAAVAKYIEYKENGFTADEIRAEIEKDEVKYKPVEIEQILAAIDAVEETEEPKEDDKPITNATKGLNRDYEEWEVSTRREDVYNEHDRPTGTKIVGFSKLKKLRVTRVTEKVADELNSQSPNTNLRLYLVGGDDE